MTRNNTGCIVSLIAALVVLVAIVGFEAVSYTPSYCARCHKAEQSFWKRSKHADAACHDCHGSRGGLSIISTKLNEYSMVLSQLTGQFDRPITAFVDNGNCMDCHTAIIDNKVIISRGIRMRHSDVISAGIRCAACHSTVAHGSATKIPTAPFMETCTPCHDGSKAPTKCDTCHVSRADPLPTGRVAPWAVTHGARWTKTHGMGNLSTCIICHARSVCVKCHGMTLPHDDSWPALHGKAAITNLERVAASDKPRSCVGCHYRTFCDGCHQMAMPHPTGFLPTHSKAYKRYGRRVCANCHNLEECNECHIKHIHPGKLRDPFLKKKAKT